MGVNNWQLTLQPWQLCICWQSIVLFDSSQQSGAALFDEISVAIADFAGQVCADNNVLAATCSGSKKLSSKIMNIGYRRILPA